MAPFQTALGTGNLFMSTKYVGWAFLWIIVAQAAATADDPFRISASGDRQNQPAGYVPPLVSNGSLCLQVDWRGSQQQEAYCRMKPGIWWAGRRYGPPKDQLVPFGHFVNEASIDGKPLAAPNRWTQTLDTKQALVTCVNEHDEGVSVETAVFVPLAHDLVAVQRRISTADNRPRTARLTFHFQFTPPGGDNAVPRRTTCAADWNETAQSAELRYQIDAYRPASGTIAVFADPPAKATLDKQRVSLSAEATVAAGRPATQTFYLLFADSLDGTDYARRADALRKLARKSGFDGLLTAHRQAWATYWSESDAKLPNERLQRMYCTAQYHLRANATKWSFPVGIFPTHWAGRFFGWDEMFCHQALISSNHRDVARRCPEFRLAGLKIALDRNAHYGRPGIFGARYPWEAFEDGNEGAPPGFWMEHVFHMSNIAQSAWFQYLYTADRNYLQQTGYPVVKECARFFLANMVYELPGGETILGKCTDLERLGPAKLNPFMTSCGAIYTLEAAAQAATLLNADAEEAAAWKQTAAKLRQSLPRENSRYVPYLGCKDESIASLGGLFPYPLFDAANELQRNAAEHYLKHGRAFGNMYDMGNAVCAWYLGWMAAAMARLNDSDTPAKLLDEAAAGAGCFGEMFEINEAKVARNPWFSTASGNVVYALNQMLVQSQGDEIRIAPAVPLDWRDYSFNLPCHGDLVVHVAVRNGRLARLTLEPGNRDAENHRTLVLPSQLIEQVPLNTSATSSVRRDGRSSLIEVRFRGAVELVGADNTPQAKPAPSRRG